MYAPAVPGCCILDRARTAAGFHRAAAWSESDRVVPQWCGNRLLCAFALIISVYSVNSVATPVVYNSAQSEKSVDRLVLPVPTPKIRRLRSELLSNFVDCLNQAADCLAPFSNLIPANTPQLIPSL